MPLDFLLDFVGESLNIPQSELSSLIKEDNPAETLAALKERDKQRVATLTDSVTKKQQEYINRGYGDAMRKVKGYVKTKYNSEFDADNAEEVIDHVFTDALSKAGQNGELTEEKLKLNPLFQAKEREFQKIMKQKEEEFNTKWSEKEKAEKRAQTISSVVKDAFNVIEPMNPIYSPKQSIANLQKSAFIREVIESHDWERGSNGEWTAFKDGKRVENEHGYPVSFEKMIKDSGNNYFEFPANNGGSNAGNGNVVKPVTAGLPAKFENEKQYVAFMKSEAGDAEKKAAMATWDAQKAMAVE